MHVGWNLLYLTPGQVGGTETYARELLGGVFGLGDDLRLTLFAPQGASDQGWAWNAHLSWHLARARLTSPYVRLLWEQLWLPWVAGRARVHLLHSLGYNAPLFAQSPQIVTIHDTNAFRVPEQYGPLGTHIRRLFLRIAARAEVVVVDSCFGGREVQRFLGVRPGRMRLIYPAVGAQFRPATAPSPGEARARYAAGAPYVLCVAANYRHKNLPLLIQALARLAKGPGFHHHLVLAGPRVSTDPELGALVSREGLASRVHRLSHLPGEEMPVLYQGADMLVLPSRYEGFGLPVLEAMACGTPVACSHRGALPEVAADAAVYFEPDRPEAVAESIARLLREPDLRDTLRSRGLEQASRFGWDRTARQTVDLYREVLAW